MSPFIAWFSLFSFGNPEGTLNIPMCPYTASLHTT